MQKKILTIHVNNLRLTRDLAALFDAIAGQFPNVSMHTSSAGLVITADNYSRSVSGTFITQ